MESSSSQLPKLATNEDLEKMKAKCLDKPIIVLLWASWDEHSQNLLKMMEEMPKVYQNVQVAYVDCDEAEDLVDALDVETVQTIVILHPTGANKATEKIEGIKAEALTEVVDRENTFYKEWYEQEKKKAFRDIEAHIGTYPFFIFIKGSKEEPKCKFTRRLVGMLAKPGYDYRTFNILGDQRIRQWMKVYSNWPTFPQLFINQQFVGGIDVVTELIEGEEFDEMVPDSCKPLSPKDQLAKMLNQSKIVLLLNGTVESPKDDASKALLEKVNGLKCEYSIIDLSAKSEFVEHLGKDQKVPYVYMDGKAACDIDGLDQLAQQEVFQVGLKQRKLTLNERIQELLKSSKVLLFMKGSPASPQCGFSQRIVAILKKYDGLEYDHFDIM